MSEEVLHLPTEPEAQQRAEDANNIAFLPWRRKKPRSEPLNDDEIDRLRALLIDSDKIMTACPIARRAVLED